MGIGQFFSRLAEGLKKTAQTLGSGLQALFGRKVDKEFLKELEKVLLLADVGIEATEIVIAQVKAQFADREANEELRDFVKRLIKDMLQVETPGLALRGPGEGPTILMIAGVNGSGKTTSIAKLASMLRSQGKSVLLGAGDTFRAAAVEQLTQWAQRTGCEIVKGAPGADPAAVAYDAVSAAVARKVDVAIIDTAGRLHTQLPLMKELEKVHRVIGKALPGAPHDVLLVLDATNGQNAILQATHFKKTVACTGIILAKLDGTAKGGSVVAIRQKLGLPVKFVGIGEKAEDLVPFDPDSFVEGLFGDRL